MAISGNATVQGMITLKEKQLGDELFDGGLDMLQAFKVLQSGKLNDYAGLIRTLSQRSTRITDLAGSLAVLDAVRGTGDGIARIHDKTDTEGGRS